MSASIVLKVLGELKLLENLTKMLRRIGLDRETHEPNNTSTIVFLPQEWIPETVGDIKDITQSKRVGVLSGVN